MNLYVTYDKDRIRKAFLNLRKQLVIDSVETVRSLGYEPSDLSKYSSFIVNDKIKKQIQKTALNDKMQSIIYTNPYMTTDIIRDIINFVQLETNIDQVIFLTDKGKHEDFYELFQGVIYFPTTKKVHILKCKPITFQDKIHLSHQ